MAGEPVATGVGAPEGSGGGGDPPERFRRAGVRRPGVVEIGRQLAIVAVVLALWSGAFRFAVNGPGRSDQETATLDRATPARSADAGGTRPDAAASPPGDAVPGSEGAGAGAAGSATPPASGGTPSEAAAPEGAGAPAPAPSEPASGPEPDPEPEETARPVGAEAPPRAAASPPAPEDPLAPVASETSVAALADTGDLPEVSFAADVMPILERRCVKCHGAPRADGTPRLEEGLDLRTWEAIMAGSTWGSVVEPGDPVASYMLELVVDGDMPDDGPRLLPREIRVLTAWIAAGAPEN